MCFNHHYQQINGVNIHYAQAGSENREKGTIIFLHGFPEYWATWREQLAYFSQDYQVIAPDLPGYNLSNKPQNHSFYQVNNLISFIATFIEQVSPKEKVYLVAHDWGGAIAWPLAAFFPHLIRKLVILNAAHPSTFTREMKFNPKQREKSNYIHELISDQAVEKLSSNNCEYLMKEILTDIPTELFDDELKAQYLRVWQREGAIAGMLQYYRAMPQLAPPASDTLSNEVAESRVEGITALDDISIPNIKINIPTLVLWGENDQAFVIENLDGLQEYVRDLAIKRFPNTSHWLQHERPQEVNEEIQAFID